MCPHTPIFDGIFSILGDEIELIATAGFGLEAVVSRELKDLGYDRQTVADGRVTFTADLAAVCRTNLWLRSADRVLVKVDSFEARDFGAVRPDGCTRLGSLDPSRR